MSHPINIELSDPLDREYNIIGVHEEDDPELEFDFSHHPKWKEKSYNLTIYNEEDRSTLASIGFTTDKFTMVIPDYSFGNIRAVAVVEDRTDIDNIDAIDTVAYIIFRQFTGGPTDVTVEGHVNVTNLDDTLIASPVYSTEIENN